MDGSPAGYYMQPGSAGTSDWILYMEGGYWCWDEPSCTARCSASSFACSSRGWQPVMAEEGLFSQLPPGASNPWSQPNKVYLKYCSSDSWLGDAPASPETFGYAFRGARVVAAVVNSLREIHGLGATPGQQLLLGGCSAGGRGAMGALDDVAGMLAADGVTVRGFIDAAAWVDVAPQIPGLQTLQQQAALQVAFIQPPLPAYCTDMYSGAEAWKCIWPSYRLPMLATPFFLNAAQVRDGRIAAQLAMRCADARASHAVRHVSGDVFDGQ